MAEKDFSYPLKVGTILRGGLRDYKVEDVLGQGGFGITYRVSADIPVEMITISATFAVKEHFIKGICERGTDGMEVMYARPTKEEYESSLDSFIKEGNRLNKICQINPNIVNVNEVFEANNTAYYVMEYLEGGDLRQMVKQNGGGISEVKALSLIRPIAKALESLHKEKLLHLDIKPDNIVMRVGKDGVADEPVLIDFGIAMHFDTKGNPTTKSKSAGFSVGYSPKEQHTTITSFSPTIDVYALGATCVYLLTGKDPIGAFEMDRRPDYFNTVFPENISERTRMAIISAMKDRSFERTPSALKFLSSLEGDVALPNRYVLKGGHYPYSIIGIEEETSYCYTYKAVRYFGSIEKSGGNVTNRDVYIIYEFYVKDFSKVRRNADGSLSGLQPRVAHKSEFDAFCRQAKELTQLDYPGEDNITDSRVNCEFFEANGTFYVVKREKWTPPIFSGLKETVSSLGESAKRIVTPKFIKVVAIFLVAGALLWLCVASYPKLKSWVKSWAVNENNVSEIDAPTYEDAITSTSMVKSEKNINGHGYVDLGLSVKWATCNVGASSPSDYGNYYAWGEIKPKSEYTKENSLTYGKDIEDIAGNSQYDVARANWGETWRLPTRTEIDELVSKCKREWTMQGEHKGYKITGPNGNSIFLPAAGWCYDTSLYGKGEHGYYWCSMPYEDNTNGAYGLDFYSENIRRNWYGRAHGRSVRPVSK